MRSLIGPIAPNSSAALASVLPVAIAASTACAQNQLWLKQFGGNLGDKITGMAPSTLR